MRAETLRLARAGRLRKGGVFEVARLAGIQAAKWTPHLVPLCHPLALTRVDVEVVPAGPRTVRVRATVEAADRTGVEMEALVAAGVAALTVYDMCKAVDRGMTIAGLRLLEKLGGASGHWTRRSARRSGAGGRD
jgi:cyclic pyranopterin phosphate synthase